MIKLYENVQFTSVGADIYKKAHDYAYNVTLTKDDIYDGQDNFDYKFQQALHGKIGEQAAYQVLSKYDATTTPPDYTVYKKYNRWDPDIKNFFGNKISVKTQTTESYRRFSLGWTFQAQKGKRYDPDLKYGNTLVCFILSGKTNENNETNCAVFPLCYINNLKWRLPDKKYLIGIKIIADGPNIYELLGINDGVLSVIVSVLDCKKKLV